MTNTLLEIRNMQIQFTNGVEAVKDVSFTLFEKESLGIAGESGSGKSILVKSLLGLEPSQANIQANKIYYQGKDLQKATERDLQKIRREDIAIIFQDPMSYLNPTMTIGRQIQESFRARYPKASRKEALKKTKEALNQVEIPLDKIDAYPHEFSGGMCQRVMIAIALVRKPKILIADEPTTALDKNIERNILSLLEKIRIRYNMAMIFITHDLDLLRSICSRVFVMYAGSIVEQGSIESCFERAKHPYTQKLLTSIPRMHTPQRLETIEGQLSIDPLQGCAFYNRCPVAKSICQKKIPKDVQFQKGHSAKCWLYDEF